MSYADEIALAQKLVQTYSVSGEEQAVAKVLIAAFEELGFDDAYVDDAGNAVGVIQRGEGKTVMLNGHIDTVPLGDEALWPHPPLSGEMAEGRLWGRGSCDMKSALACMAFAARDAFEANITGTVLVTGVVLEEVGGLGARHLAEQHQVDLTILGEPSKLNLMLGHRGRMQAQVHFEGRIAHAAKAELGHNALVDATAFVQRVAQQDFESSGVLGKPSLTPTQLKSFPEDGANVVPGRAEVTIDFRNTPDYDEVRFVELLQSLAPKATIQIRQETFQSGGVAMEIPNVVNAYLTPGEHPRVERARAVLKQQLPDFGVDYHERVWWFGTDAPHLAKMGGPVIGFGPGEEELAHTTQESVPVDHLRIARQVYKSLVQNLLQ